MSGALGNANDVKARKVREDGGGLGSGGGYIKVRWFGWVVWGDKFQIIVIFHNTYRLV